MSVSAAFRSEQAAPSRGRTPRIAVRAPSRPAHGHRRLHLSLFGSSTSISAGRLSYFDISFMASGGGDARDRRDRRDARDPDRRLRSLGRRGDLAGQRRLASSMDPASTHASIVLWTLAGIGVGMATGAFNGFFIAFLRPAADRRDAVDHVHRARRHAAGDGEAGRLGREPARQSSTSATRSRASCRCRSCCLPCVLLLWLWLKSTPLRRGDLRNRQRRARRRASAGVRVELTRFLTYVIAGGCYGLAGVFISAQTGSGDPLVGNPMLLSDLHGGRPRRNAARRRTGRPDSARSFGAYILMIVVNVLLVLNVSAYYSTIAEGTILILAVLAASLSARLRTRARSFALWRARFSAWRAGIAAAPNRRWRSAPARSPREAGPSVAAQRSAAVLDSARRRLALRPAFLRLFRGRRRGHRTLARQAPFCIGATGIR